MSELYRLDGRVLFAFVLRLVDDQGRAEDVVQETLLRAWQNLDAIDPRRGDQRSYLLTVAHNIVIDSWRAQRRRPRLVSNEEGVSAQFVDDGLDAHLDAWLVQAAVDRLSVEHRAVIDELYYRGSTVTQAASALGIPAGTVKSRSYYAVRVLRVARRRQRRLTVLASAAAAALLVGLGFLTATLVARNPGEGGTNLVATASSNARGETQLVAKPWGTS